MRRVHLPVLLAGAALLLAGLSACASDDAPSTVSPADAGADAASSSTFPVTLEHKYGSTTIESAPQRVVTVGLTEQDALLALGIVPVATTNWFGDDPGRIFPWAQDELGDGEVPVVLDSEKEFEKVASLAPDLIIAIYSGITEDDYALLSDIAPTVASSADYVDYGTPWQEATRTVGEAVGKADEADALVADVEQQVADAAADHPEFAGEDGAVVTMYEGIFVYGPEDPRGRFMTDLGFSFPDGLLDVGKDEFGASISVENAAKVDVDALVWINGKDVVDEGVPTYANLAVAKQGRDVFVPEEDPLYDATSFQTVLSIPFLLDGLVPRLAAAVDGDTATATD